MNQDQQAYAAYPHHRKWFNKLWLSEALGYNCGPAGIAPAEYGVYVVRPIYNLSGMGVGAERKVIKQGDVTRVPPGYFWCEYFPGKHYSATYEFVQGTKIPYWKPIACWEGISHPRNLQRFREWKRSDYIPEVPRLINQLSDVPIINIEFKGNQVIEVHLRDTPDPQYDHLIPTWYSDQYDGKMLKERHEQMVKDGYTWISDYDDADGQLADPRTGFWVR